MARWYRSASAVVGDGGGQRRWRGCRFREDRLLGLGGDLEGGQGLEALSSGDRDHWDVSLAVRVS